MSDQDAWDAKVAEIAALIGRELFGEGPLTDEQRADARQAAYDALDDWEEAENVRIEGLEANTPLQQLLAEQHELAERILDAGDADLFKDGDMNTGE